MRVHETGRASRKELLATALAMLVWVGLVAGGVACLVLRLLE